MDAVYITTPIYYVNDRPHLGTAYSTIAADVLARYHKLRGRRVRFLTGVDEHGLKLERRAKEEGLAPQAFVDGMAPHFQDAWAALGCDYDDFIRTTSERHKARVQELWRRCADAGDIYLGKYEDWYCVACEQYYPESELLPERVCPVHKKPVERISEESYFFKLSAYGDKLLDFYAKHADFVKPESRYNEVKRFVESGLRDLSISRTSFRWGVPVPGDSKHVMYVWFDALANYISALGGPATPATDLFQRFWGGDARILHVLGKDILRFHAVYWPAFLMSAGLRVPTQILAHGWLTINGEKMSKSSRVGYSPEALITAAGADPVRYYLMREVVFGQDGDFSGAGLAARYQGDLANGLGNLLNRVAAGVVVKRFDGVIPAANRHSSAPDDVALRECAARTLSSARDWFEQSAPHRALEALWELVGETNRYVDRTAPWELAKKGETERLGDVVYHVLEVLRALSVVLWPIMPQKAAQLRAQLGLKPLWPNPGYDAWPGTWGALTQGQRLGHVGALFPKLDDAIVAQLQGSHTTPGTAMENTTAKPQNAAADTHAAPPGPAPSDKANGLTSIEFDDFAKVELRVAHVLDAERVPKSEKLLRLTLDAGDPEPRQIVAGIAQHYDPEALKGRSLVIVANLKPRKLMGLESRGMVLAGSDESGLSVLGFDKVIKPGSRVG